MSRYFRKSRGRWIAEDWPVEALRYLFLMFKRFSALTEFELVLFHVISHACKTLLASPILNDIAELPQSFQKKMSMPFFSHHLNM